MKRSAGVTAIAVFALIGSLLTLAIGCLMGMVFAVMPPDKALDPNLQPMVKIGKVIFVIILIGFGAWGITSAIGLFRLRQWARISTIVFSALLISFGFLCGAFILVLPMTPPPNANAAIMRNVKLAMSGFYFGLAAIGAWWMAYLVRRSAKLEFAAGAAPGEPPRRPLSIAIIGWLLIVGACFIPINLLTRMPSLFFGYVLTGWMSYLFLILMAAVSLVAGIGLLRLRPEARILAIAYFVFAISNSFVTWVLPGSSERMEKMMAAMPPAFRGSGQTHIDPRIFALIFAPLFLVQLFFLIANNKAFNPPPPPLSPPELPPSFPA